MSLCLSSRPFNAIKYLLVPLLCNGTHSSEWDHLYLEIPQFQLPLTLFHAKRHTQRLWSCMFEESTAPPTPLTPCAYLQHHPRSGRAVGPVPSYQVVGAGIRGPALPHHSVLPQLPRTMLLEALSARRVWAHLTKNQSKSLLHPGLKGCPQRDHFTWNRPKQPQSGLAQRHICRVTLPGQQLLSFWFVGEQVSEKRYSPTKT